MKFPKKSLGQNFLIDKNIISKIINLVEIEDKNIIEIGPGTGSLTKEIIKKKPKSFLLIEKDKNLYDILVKNYASIKNLNIRNSDILKFNLEKNCRKDTVVFGNLPYNISSQILVKFIKFKNWPPNFTDLILMFQKELGEKILGKFTTKNYSRISIISNYRLEASKKFLVSPNCFFPKPKINSMIIHFKPKIPKISKIKNLRNLEKVTNILFSNKRKMINKNIKRIINNKKIDEIKNLNLKSRPSEIEPDIYYKITELYEDH